MLLETMRLPNEADAIAADGSEVRILLRTGGGSVAHYRLHPGQVSTAVAHRTIDEIWFVLGGHGEMWRKYSEEEDIVVLEPGVTLTIPLGTWFQFRSLGGEPLDVIGTTMPPWPGDDEAYEVEGIWEPQNQRQRGAPVTPRLSGRESPGPGDGHLQNRSRRRRV